MAACDFPSRPNCLFMVTDQLFGAKLVIDTGAKIGVVPLTKANHLK